MKKQVQGISQLFLIFQIGLSSNTIKGLFLTKTLNKFFYCNLLWDNVNDSSNFFSNVMWEFGALVWETMTTWKIRDIFTTKYNFDPFILFIYIQNTRQMEDERKHDYKLEFNGLSLLNDVGRFILYSRRTAVKVILFLPQLSSSVYKNPSLA